MKLKNNVVLVTGASTGIGKSTAFALAKAGAKVVITYNSSRWGAIAAQKECAKFGHAEILKLNVTSDSSIKNAVKFVQRKFGKLDALVNNAGVGYFAHFDILRRKEIEEMFGVNVIGTMMMSKHFLPMLKQQKESVIVNIASMAGYHVWEDGSVYCPTKWAVRAFTKALAIELPKRIKIYNVNPDRTKTSMGGWQGDDPNDVAEIVVNTIKGTYSKRSGADIDVPNYL